MDLFFQLRLLLDVMIAVGLGAFLGAEREYHKKPAGLRTHMLLTGSASLLTLLGMLLTSEMEHSLSDQALGVDPTRIVHAIIVGISVIGGGTILKVQDGDHVRYLTTAASMLFAAGVGIAVALRLYPLAVGSTLIVIITNTIIRKIFPG